MTQLSKAVFQTTYADTSGTFANNTSRDISESDLRQFAEDIKDSCTFEAATIGPINYAIIELGDWNMDTTANISIGTAALATAGISDYRNIRSVYATIRNDNNDSYLNLEGYDVSNNLMGRITGATSIGISFFRIASGFFDSTDFDSTSYNRGFALIGYV